MVVGWVAALAPARAEIEIDIEGVDAELRRNVLAFLSLERYKDRDDLDEALMERLQERAVREARDALRPFGYYEPKVETPGDAQRRPHLARAHPHRTRYARSSCRTSPCRCSAPAPRTRACTASRRTCRCAPAIR